MYIIYFLVFVTNSNYSIKKCISSLDLYARLKNAPAKDIYIYIDKKTHIRVRCHLFEAHLNVCVFMSVSVCAFQTYNRRY